ncbi:uncharacterized protein KY384_001795 [Bacidia gigantensis]|uniref:uncharacterized protein n=1 Tax=Bacidia gigantensis TaxID=2732470 RepID=UPI001D049ADF|nr:uncharacterized protein KY384_001795 [Bacidia gigantensis]KAG8533013.1 hypothetical protein KY384_001795 [Bacidia gigantensis]
MVSSDLPKTLQNVLLKFHPSNLLVPDLNLHHPSSTAIMNKIVETLLPCLFPSTHDGRIQLPAENANHHPLTPSEKTGFYPQPTMANKPSLTNHEAADAIIVILYSTNMTTSSVTADINSIVHQAGGWSEYLAKKILSAMEAALKAAKPMSAALKTAYDKTCEAAKEIEGFVAEHPIATGVFCTVVALGVLWLLAPSVLAWLGFGLELEEEGWANEGCYVGSWAAAWQSTYGGFVSEDSLFAFFQRLGAYFGR